MEHGEQPSLDSVLSGRTYIAAVEGQLQEVRGTVSDHVLERVVIQPEILPVKTESLFFETPHVLLTLLVTSPF